MDISLSQFLGSAASLVLFACYVPYLYEMKYGRVRPHAFTWLLWGLLQAITWKIQFDGGAGAGAWVTALDSVICFYIAIYALRSSRDFTRSDWIALGVALCALVAWKGTDQPIVALTLICAVNIASFYPTFRKSYNAPYEEAAYFYLSDVLEITLAIGALGVVSTVTVLPFACDLALSVGFVGFLLWRRQCLKQKDVQIIYRPKAFVQQAVFPVQSGYRRALRKNGMQPACVLAQNPAAFHSLRRRSK